ncbi:hypothetical protein [Pontibacter pamirensis]|uniref:hypothetical protein n=1 Tax=Pontibacter pamirensis TaxID=2562824 RepID=UPI00138A47CD|nr:hypothetical protein [Pontibacter pamirensis]
MKQIFAYVGRFVNPIAALASILSLVVIFFASKPAAYAAAAFIVIAVLFLVYKLCIVLDRFVKNTHPDEFLNHSLFIRYSTTDRYNIEFEVFKHIQCKRMFQTEYPYKFKWSGSKQPLISSSMQIVDNSITSSGQDSYDSVILRFREPLYYNDTAVVHFKANLDDRDLASATHLETKISYKTSVIHFRAELLYKNGKKIKPAVLERKKIESTLSTHYEPVLEVPFIGKSYQHHLITPEIGYFYRLRWDR